jgi:heme A synthase
MERDVGRTKRRFGAHVHVYLGVAVVLLALCLLVLWAFIAPGDDWRIDLALLALFTGSLVLSLWATVRACSSPDLTWLEGLLTITACMSIGVGYLSVLIAVPCALASILTSMLLTIVGTVRRDPRYAPAAFLKMVNFWYRHRMYQ